MNRARGVHGLTRTSTEKGINVQQRRIIGDTALSRRDFGKLTMAAFGGMVLGTALAGHAAEGADTHDPSLLLGEKHVCRGLNTCKGKAKGGDNSCAGMGNCATVDAHSCKSHGSCEVPLKKKAWKAARKAFEKQMKTAGKTFGEAPKAA